MSSLKVGDTRQIVDMVVDAQVEIGMVGARINHPSVRYEPFEGDRLILVALPEDPLLKMKGVTLKDLVEAPFILREHGSGTRMALQRSLQEVSLGFNDLNIVAEMGSTQAVVQAVKGGVGVSILSNRAVEDELRFGVLQSVPVEGFSINRDFFLVVHRNRTLSPICTAFLEFCLSRRSSQE